MQQHCDLLYFLNHQERLTQWAKSIGDMPLDDQIRRAIEDTYLDELRLINKLLLDWLNADPQRKSSLIELEIIFPHDTALRVPVFPRI